MNTPRSKPPKRWSEPTTYLREAPEGTSFGIRNTEISNAFGFLVSYWWHVEEVMIGVLNDLLNGNTAGFIPVEVPARQVFRSIVSQEARIKVMRSLLEGLQRNKDFPLVYDEIIEEFSSLNNIRNKLVHGIWHTDGASGNVNVKKSTDQHEIFEKPETITEMDLKRIISRMQSLHTKATLRGQPYPS